MTAWHLPDFTLHVPLMSSVLFAEMFIRRSMLHIIDFSRNEIKHLQDSLHFNAVTWSIQNEVFKVYDTVFIKRICVNIFGKMYYSYYYSMCLFDNAFIQTQSFTCGWHLRFVHCTLFQSRKNSNCFFFVFLFFFLTIPCFFHDGKSNVKPESGCVFGWLHC